MRSGQVFQAAGRLAALAVVAGLTTAVYHWVERDRVTLWRAERALGAADPERAIVLFEALLARGVPRGEVCPGLAAAYLSVGRREDARALAIRYVSEPEARPGVRGRVVDEFIRRRAFDVAEDLARMILREQPADRVARMQLARLLSWGGRFDESIHHYKLLLGETDEEDAIE